MLTLGKALDLLKQLEAEDVELYNNSIRPLEQKSFRGNDYNSMDIPKLLYFIGTNAIIIEAINALPAGEARDFASKQAQLDYLVETMQNMRALIVFRAKYETLSQKITAIQKFIGECDESEKKKIRKEEKIAKLKALGLW